MLCERTSPGESFLLVASDSGNRSKKTLHKRIFLDEAKYDRLNELYEAALDFNARDDVMGVDGSDWCLETRRVSVDLRVCIWSPTMQTAERRLTGLASLGRELWHVSDIQQVVGNLY
jgi:hypothetical protein